MVFPFHTLATIPQEGPWPQSTFRPPYQQVGPWSRSTLSPLYQQMGPWSQSVQVAYDKKQIYVLFIISQINTDICGNKS